MSPYRLSTWPACATALALAGLPGDATAGYSTNTQASGSQMVDALLAPSSGLQLVGGSVVTVGAPRQNGIVTAFDVENRPSAPGIGLTSGMLTSPTEPGHQALHVATGTGSHALIAAALGQETLDQSVLRFSVTADPGWSFVTGLMVFGTDEYPGLLSNPEFGDGLMILVDGIDVARIEGKPFTGAVVHEFLGLEAGPGATGWNGLTPTLRFTAALDPLRTTHSIEFAIADTGDTLYDSSMFLFQLQGVASGVPGLATAVPEPDTWALWSAGFAGLLLARRHARRDAR